MTSVIEKEGMFDGGSSQENDTGLNSLDSSESDGTDNEDDIEMSANQEGSPSTGITTIVCTHPSSVITDDRIYEYIHRDYFVDSKTQARNTVWWDKDISKWDKLKEKVSNEILDYLKTRMIVEAQKQNIKVKEKNLMVDVCKWSNIGLSFKQHSTNEIAMK